MVGLSTNKAFCRANINSFLFEYEIWNWHLKCRAKSTNHICCQREPRYWNQSENSLILVSMMQLFAIWKCWWPFVTGCRCQRCLRIYNKKFLATLLFSMFFHGSILWFWNESSGAFISKKSVSYIFPPQCGRHRSAQSTMNATSVTMHALIKGTWGNVWNFIPSWSWPQKGILIVNM